MFETTSGKNFENIQEAIREEKNIVIEFDEKIDVWDKKKLTGIFAWWSFLLVMSIVLFALVFTGIINENFAGEDTAPIIMGIIFLLIFSVGLIPNGDYVYSEFRSAEYKLNYFRTKMVEQKIGGKITQGFPGRNSWREVTVEFENEFKNVFVKIETNKNNEDEIVFVKNLVLS